MIDGEPFACAPEAGHDFIRDHKDSVFVAQLAYTLHISIRWNKDAVRAYDGFKNERRDRVRAFELHDLFNHGERGLSRIPSTLDAVIRIETCTTPGMPGSAAQRRGSPVSVMLPAVAP